MASESNGGRKFHTYQIVALGWRAPQSLRTNILEVLGSGASAASGDWGSRAGFAPWQAKSGGSRQNIPPALTFRAVANSTTLFPASSGCAQTLESPTEAWPTSAAHFPVFVPFMQTFPSLRDSLCGEHLSGQNPGQIQQETANEHLIPLVFDLRTPQAPAVFRNFVRFSFDQVKTSSSPQKTPKVQGFATLG